MLNSRKWRAGIAVLTIWLTACMPVKLVSDYDEKLDQGVTEVQKKVEAILTKIEGSKGNPSSTYKASDYSAINEDLNVLITRAASSDKNELTSKQLHTLGFSLLQSPPIPPEDLKVPQIKEGQSLQQRHQSATPFSADDIRDLRALLGNRLEYRVQGHACRRTGYDMAAQNVLFSVEGMTNLIVEKAYNAARAVLVAAVKAATGGWVLL